MSARSSTPAPDPLPHHRLTGPEYPNACACPSGTPTVQPVLGLVFLAALLALGLRWRLAPVSRLLLAVGGIGLVLLLGWGAYWFVADGSLFPEFSELGWI